MCLLVVLAQDSTPCERAMFFSLEGRERELGRWNIDKCFNGDCLIRFQNFLRNEDFFFFFTRILCYFYCWR